MDSVFQAIVHIKLAVFHVFLLLLQLLLFQLNLQLLDNVTGLHGLTTRLRLLNAS